MINRYLGEDTGSDAGAQVGAEPGGGQRITDSRPAGGAWLLDRLWQQLGIGAVLHEVRGGRRFATDVQRVAFALVGRHTPATPPDPHPRRSTPRSTGLIDLPTA